jgi:hypothetical protein
MNRSIKTLVAAFAVIASVNSFAQEAGADYEETIGWTPIAVGLATPVQVPWGVNLWDVYGLDVNLFYADAPKMYGLQVGGFVNVNRDTMIGMEAAGLLNYADSDVYGLRATLGLNACRKTVYGMDVGTVGLRDAFVGFDANLLGSAQHRMTGVQISGLCNIADVKSHGFAFAFGANLADEASGIQIAACLNMTKKLSGAQIGLVNFTRECPSGFQIGLVNIIMENLWPVIPFVNASF